MPLLYQHRPEWLLGKGLWIKVHDKKLVGKWRFHMKNDLSCETYFLLKDGYLKQFSIGFISKSKTANGVHLKTELLETSIVSLASNVNTAVLETKVHNPILRKELQLNSEPFDYFNRAVQSLSPNQLQEMVKSAVAETVNGLRNRIKNPDRNITIKLNSGNEIEVDEMTFKKVISKLNIDKLIKENLKESINIEIDRRRGKVY